ncbi:MAG: prolipoprotein diacylglyceryl transferase [Clostridia bacterium]|nr:prolipoprotein diacylglyceryl transferase [Clostridia bacterium]
MYPLFVTWDVNHELVHLWGNFGLRWYSLLFVSGFIIGYFIFRWFVRREGVKESILDPLLYTLLIATIVGARLGHCIFYEPQDYFTSWHGFWEIFKPWHGGLASHGGAIALVLAMIWFARHYGRKNGFDFWWIMDHLVITVCFAGALIRLGNLFNSEIYGAVTEQPWGFIFVRDPHGDGLPHHPTQLYEAGGYILLGLALLWLYVKKLPQLKRGTIFGIFMIGLFGIRFIVEFIKNDQVDFEAGMALNMGQLLSIPFIIAGFVVLWWSLKHAKPAPAAPPVAAVAGPQKKAATHYAKGLGE